MTNEDKIKKFKESMALIEQMARISRDYPHENDESLAQFIALIAVQVDAAREKIELSEETIREAIELLTQEAQSRISSEMLDMSFMHRRDCSPIREESRFSRVPLGQGYKEIKKHIVSRALRGIDLKSADVTEFQDFVDKEIDQKYAGAVLGINEQNSEDFADGRISGLLNGIFAEWSRIKGES